MKTAVEILIIIVTCSFFYNCNNKEEEKNHQNNDTLKKTDIPVKTGVFYEIDTTKGNALVLAEKITYDVIVKNPNPNDDWTQECLQNFNSQSFANIIFNAVYNKRLIAYNYKTGNPISIEDVKEFEKEFKRKHFGKIMFEEVWYFNENTLQMGKKINAITLGYELRDSEGNIRDGYKAAFKVFLNN